MSQPGIDFEFDPPEFVRDDPKSSRTPKKLNILRHLTAAGLLLAAAVGLVLLLLLYANVSSHLVLDILTRKQNDPMADASAAVADAQALLAKLEEKTTSLTERIAALESNLYRSKAAALGFKNPSIRPVNLAAQQTQPSSFNYQVKKEHYLELRILQITKEAIVLEVTGTASNNETKAMKILQPLKVGTSVELTQGFRVEGMPHIFMTVLEIPTKDTAIIAVGAKELAQS
jgi:uncharacterized coiled-coil protein SlyX